MLVTRRPRTATPKPSHGQLPKARDGDLANGPLPTHLALAAGTRGRLRGVGAGSTAGANPTVPDYSVCPPIGLDTGPDPCGILIDIENTGASVYGPNEGPFDGS